MDALANAFLQVLLKTQFLSRDAMRAYQRDLLERLVRHARARVPFYGDGRLDPLFRNDGGIAWDRWHEIPVLTRAEAQTVGERLFAEEVPPECGAVIDGRTSGSTGRPLHFRLNSLMAAAGSAMLERGLVWAGLPPIATFAWLRYDYAGLFSYPAGAAYWTDIRGARRTMHVLSVATAIEDQCHWLQRIKPDVVMGYPNGLALLGEALPTDLAAHTFRLVICNGEVAAEQARQTIERTFRCPTMNLYSGSEIGTIAVEDCRLRRLYASEEATLLEAGATDVTSAGAQAMQELVVTPLYNYAMPLIRYAPGDLVIFDAGPASDGRALRRLSHIAGRERSAFTLPSGRRWWPTFIPNTILRYLAFEQIQLAQTSRHRVEVRFVSRDLEPVKDADGLLAYLHALPPEPMEFAPVRVADIPRGPSGKFEDAVCEIDAASSSRSHGDQRKLETH